MVAINSFVTDTEEEIETVKRLSREARVISCFTVELIQISLSSKIKPVQSMQFYVLIGLMVVLVLLT